MLPKSIKKSLTEPFKSTFSATPWGDMREIQSKTTSWVGLLHPEGGIVSLGLLIEPMLEVDPSSWVQNSDGTWDATSSVLDFDIACEGGVPSVELIEEEEEEEVVEVKPEKPEKPVKKVKPRTKK